MQKWIKISLAAAVFAPLLMAQQCSSTAPTITVADIQNAIKTACGYQPEIAYVEQVANSIAAASGNPVVGGAVVLTSSIQQATAAAICSQYATQMAAMKAKGAKEPGPVSVVVSSAFIDGKTVTFPPITVTGTPG